MNNPSAGLPQLLADSPIRVHVGSGAISALAGAIAELACQRVLIVTDRAIRSAGHVDRVISSLDARSVTIDVFDEVESNPSSHTIGRGADVARRSRPDTIIGLGGGSAMDAAKGVNLLHVCGGEISSYRGDPDAYAVATRARLLPMILIPTTAGTGSEAQSFALISDSATHMKLACGDRRSPGGLRPRYAILDADLTATMPRSVAAATGLDALSHAIETTGCRVRTERSQALSREAWRRLSACFERSLENPSDAQARSEMLLGAHLAGTAIEASMLGAAHACANPLTAEFDLVHGFAVGLVLPHVIRFNSEGRDSPYADLDPSAESLACRVERALDAAGAPRRLRDAGVSEEVLGRLADLAATQWTANFNPRPVLRDDLFEIYRRAF